MLTEKNVKVGRSQGAECIVCDHPIRRGDPIIEITFKILVPVRKELHAGDCAKELRELLDLRIREAAGQ